MARDIENCMYPDNYCFECPNRRICGIKTANIWTDEWNEDNEEL